MTEPEIYFQKTDTVMWWETKKVSRLRWHLWNMRVRIGSLFARCYCADINTRDCPKHGPVC
jgi:hypothetical protein